MLKIKELLQNISEDILFNNRDDSFSSLINFSRDNNYYSKLMLLVKNSDLSKNIIIENIAKMAVDDRNDFRIFTLLVVLFDSYQKEAFDLSRLLLEHSNLKCTKMIALNILLEESLYGN